MLNKYLQQTQRLLNDMGETNFNRADLVDYINEARQQIAAEGQCVRVLPANNLCVVGQEVYNFTDVDLSGNPGASEIIAVRGVSLLWDTYRYTLAKYGFAKYQALVRTYANTFSDVPRTCAQFGQGEAGSLYIYPLPNSPYVMEWDCICDVTPMVTDADVELIPAPWNTPVQYYAAYKAIESTGNFEASMHMSKQFSYFMKRARAFTTPSGVINWYGRG